MFSDRTNWKLTRNRLTEALEEVRAGGARVLDLTISNPTRAGLRYGEGLIMQSLASPHAMDYDPQPKGLASARASMNSLLLSGAERSRCQMPRWRVSSSSTPASMPANRMNCTAIPANECA